jgi:hypothetical protein
MANVTDVIGGAHCYVTRGEYRKRMNWFSRFSPYRQSLLWCYWCIQGSSLVGWGCCVVSTGKASQSLVDFPILSHNVTYMLLSIRFLLPLLYSIISRTSWFSQLVSVITTDLHLILEYPDGSYFYLLSSVCWLSQISLIGSACFFSHITLLRALITAEWFVCVRMLPGRNKKENKKF